MKIATWNVNSIKARLPRVLEWLAEAAPDVALLQEIKTVAESFPEAEIGDLGYNTAVLGQKSYNGVAILAKRPIEDVVEGLPGDDDDDQARYLEAVIDGVRVATIYLPNGNPTDTPKFPYKLAWMERLYDHARTLLAYEEPLVLGGDYNIAPTDADVFDPAAWAGDALCRPDSRSKFRAIVNLGLTEAYRARHPNTAGAYSFWDYQRGRWQRDEGLRIDHLLLSPQAADRLGDCDIDRKPRGHSEKPSDHTPVWCELREESP